MTRPVLACIAMSRCRHRASTEPRHITAKATAYVNFRKVSKNDRFSTCPLSSSAPRRVSIQHPSEKKEDPLTISKRMHRRLAVPLNPGSYVYRDWQDREGTSLDDGREFQVDRRRRLLVVYSLVVRILVVYS